MEVHPPISLLVPIPSPSLPLPPFLSPPILVPPLMQLGGLARQTADSNWQPTDKNIYCDCNGHVMSRDPNGDVFKDGGCRCRKRYIAPWCILRLKYNAFCGISTRTHTHAQTFTHRKIAAAAEPQTELYMLLSIFCSKKISYVQWKIWTPIPPSKPLESIPIISFTQH